MQMTAANIDRLGDASYSPEDNKLRMRPFARLSAEDYARFKAAGFSWAPRQELFVAPMWTPERADLLQETCGEIGDEDTSLVERAEERADRFEDYSDKRKDDADRAHKAVAAIADNIPLGQPILVGHHSEKHARKDAERIQNGMRKAVRMWETSKYWQERARGALAHARYKELPAVRHRRIKGLEADKRKLEKEIKEADLFLSGWRKVDASIEVLKQDGSVASLKERAMVIANYDRVSACFTLAKYPRELPASQYEGSMSLYSALDDNIITAEQARDIAIRVRERGNVQRNRWLAHTNFRLEYERAMLDEGGGLAADKFNIEVGGRVWRRRAWFVVTKVNRIDGRINSVSVMGHFASTVSIEEVTDYQPPEEGVAEKVKAATKLAPLVNYPGDGFRHMLKAEYESHSKHSDAWRVCKITASDKYGAHRLRKAPPEKGEYWKTIGVYLTDAKRVDPPMADAAVKVDVSSLQKIPASREVPTQPYKAPEPTPFDAMKDSLKAGVQVVAVDQLFETPPELARRIVAMAEIDPGMCVLEPSAGTGNIVRAILDSVDTEVLAYEINQELCSHLSRSFPSYKLQVRCRDFLEVDDFTGCYPRIVMNPPFADRADVRHVRHAWEMLAPGGRLVAIMSAGVKFRTDKAHVAFRALVEANGEIEDLPADSFKASGTGVATVVVTLTKG